jgi:hypothetical protein
MDHVLFVHIPKTGGVSIQSVIRKQVPEELINPAPVASFIQDTDWSRIQQYRFFFTHTPIYIRNLLPSPLFTFTFLRNPIDRVISSYNHMLRHDGPEHRMIVQEKLAVIDCLEQETLRYPFQNMMTRMLGTDIDLRLVWDNVDHVMAAHTCAMSTTPDEFTFRRAVAQLDKIDFVGLTKNIDQDCGLLLAQLKLRVVPVPRENAGSIAIDKELPQAVRTPEVEAAIASHNGYDLELYRCAQELISRRRPLNKTPICTGPRLVSSLV